MGLEFESTDWLAWEKKQKEKIVDEIASQLHRECPDLFTGQTILSGDRAEPERIIRQGVHRPFPPRPTA